MKGAEKYHNDEKVMREVKSVAVKHQKPKFDGNLRIGGTDHREHKLIYPKKIEQRGTKE